MTRMLSSPRWRRRLTWLGAGFAIVLAVVLAVLLVPDSNGPKNVAPAKHAPKAQIVKVSHRVSPADRRAIDKVLDRFVPNALNHRNMGLVWKLSGPELTGGTTLREWKSGTTPFPTYPVLGKHFPWTTIDAGPNYVDFNLIVHPRPGAKVAGAWVFNGEMLRRGSHWLVNGLYTVALLNPPTKSGQHEVGPADYAAGAASSPSTSSGNSSFGQKWLLLVAGLVIALVILFPVGFGVVSLERSRRRRRRFARQDSNVLPPLPDRVRPPKEPGEDRALAGRRD